MNKKIWAFIPARSGSKSIIDKNIKLFCGKPLIYYTIKLLDKIKVDKIIFSTDSLKYVKIAQKYRKDISIHLRSKKTSTDKATDLDVFKEFINQKKIKNSLPDFFLHLRPTTPFRRVNIVKKAILVSLYDNKTSMDKLNVARQNFPDTFMANGYVDILKTETLLKNQIHGDKVYGFLTKDFNSDIDSIEDFKTFEAFLLKNANFKKYFLHSRNRYQS